MTEWVIRLFSRHARLWILAVIGFIFGVSWLYVYQSSALGAMMLMIGMVIGLVFIMHLIDMTERNDNGKKT